MDKFKKKFILSTILETGIFDSPNSQNSLLNNVINKRRKKLRIQQAIFSIFDKETNRNSKCTKLRVVPVKNNKSVLSLIEQFSDDDFKRNFMMKRNTFMEIVNYLKLHWIAKTGRPLLSIETALYITLWKLTKNCTFSEISSIFNISERRIFTYFIKVVNLLYVHRKDFIKWPKDRASKLNIIENFKNSIKKSIPNTIGCVDAIHVSIVPPKENNGKYSILLQGICDNQEKFIDVFFGEPGSLNKSSVWENSPINDVLRNNSESTENEYILGDMEYSLKPYLIVPYDSNGILTAKQKYFNYQHNSTRVCVEQAFKTLKTKFPILDGIDIKELDYVKYTAIACVVLYNIIIEKEGTVDIYSRIEDYNRIVANQTGVSKNNELNKAIDIRDKLAQHYE